MRKSMRVPLVMVLALVSAASVVSAASPPARLKWKRA
jgi:hypothetical protein